MVKRYHDPGDWIQSPTGEFVRYEDYAKLEVAPARPMVFGDIFLCYTCTMQDWDDMRKAWIWYTTGSKKS